MRSDAYYRRWIIKTLLVIFVISYSYLLISSLLVVVGASNYMSNDFIKNYDNSFSDIIMLNNDSNVHTSTDSDNYLSNIEYDINSLYLDWSDIEKEREKLKAEKYENSKHESSNRPTFGESLKLPDLVDSSFKGYMCLHKVTSRSSKQWEFLHSGKYELHTDKNGILMYENYYVVAMGSYYTNYKVGSTFRITLDSGVVFDVITGDEKADIDTDSLNMYRPKGSGHGEIIEFLIACGAEGASCNKYHTMSAKHRAMGDLSSLGFQGDVIKIEKLDDFRVSNELYS